MRFLLACVMVAVAAPATAKVMMTPPIPRLCRGPSAWSVTAACLAKYGAKDVPTPTSSIAVVEDRMRTYLFVERGDRQWRFAVELPDTHVELIGRHPMKDVGERIDLRHRIDVGPLDVVTARMAVVCSDTSCTAYVYDCTRMVRGRAAEVLHGELVIENGAPRVSGDRSQTGTYCNR